MFPNLDMGGYLFCLCCSSFWHWIDG